MSIRTFENQTPTLGDNVYVDDSSVVIGNVNIGHDSSIWPLCVLRGDIHKIEIGTRTSIQDGCVIHVTHDGPFNPGGFPTIIGDEVTIAHKVMLHGCKLASRILIGMGAVVMDGVIIDSEVIVGGGSLVPPGKKLESGYLYVGSPVKKIRKLTEKEIEFFSYTSGKYVELKNRYLLENVSS